MKWTGDWAQVAPIYKTAVERIVAVPSDEPDEE